MIYFTSDLHLFHRRIYEWYPGRESESEIVRVWNSQVNINDTIFVLGDLTFGNFERTYGVVSSLKGRIILVLGNHDRNSLTWYRRLGIEVIKGPVAIEPRLVLSHYPRYPFVLRQLYYRLFDPLMLRYLERHVVGYDDYLVVHGHVHSRWQFDRLQRQLNVGWDAWHRLLSLDEVLRYC